MKTNNAVCDRVHHWNAQSQHGTEGLSGRHWLWSCYGVSGSLLSVFLSLFACIVGLGLSFSFFLSFCLFVSFFWGGGGGGGINWFCFFFFFLMG